MTETTQGLTLEMTRRFAAPVEQVYRAWVEPELLRQWFAPFDATIPNLELDVRPGGKYRIEILNGDTLVVLSGEYSRVEKGSALSFTWDASMPDGTTLHTAVDVAFHAVDGETEVRMQQHVFPDAELLQFYKLGWESCYDQLTAHLN